LVYSFTIHTFAGVNHKIIAPLGNPHGGTVGLIHELVEGFHAALLELILTRKGLVHNCVDFVFKVHQFVHHLHRFLAKIHVGD